MKGMLKKGFLVLFVAFAFVFSPVLAQDDEEITDHDLFKYALMEQVIEQMKKDISAEVNNMIKAQEGMTGSRFKELNATRGDKNALEALDAQEFEIKFLELITDLQKDRIEAIKTVNSELAKKMVGEKGRAYKRIQEALKTDEDVQARYQTFVKQVTFIDLNGI